MKIPTESRSSRSGGRDASASSGSNGRDGSSTTNGGIGGIPRPHVTNSPSKLAVRTNTKLLAGGGSKQDGNSNGTGHHSRTSTANGDLRNGGLPEPSLRYGGGSNGTSGLVYKGGSSSSSSKTLVNDKLYPNRNLAFRSSSPPRSMGHSAHHQASPQRSQTLSLIPSHQSSRLKTGSSSSSKSAVSQNITTTSSVRFSGVDHISSSTGIGVATTTTTTANSSSRSFSNGYHSSSLGSNTTTKGIMKTSSTPSPPSHSTNSATSQYQHPFASNHNPQATTYPTPGPAYSIPQHASYPNGPSYSNVHNSNNSGGGQNGHLQQQNGQIGHPNNSSNSSGDNSRKFANFSSSSQMGSAAPSSNSHHVMTASSNHSAAVVTSSATAGRTGSSSVPPPPSSSSQLPTSGISSGNNSSIKQQHNISQPQHHGGHQLPHHGGQHHQQPHMGGQPHQQPHQGSQQHHQQQHSSGHQSQQQLLHQQQGGGNTQVHHQHPNKYQHQGSGNKTGTLDHDRSTGSGGSAQPSYRHPNFGGHHPFGPASNYAQASNAGNQYSNNPSPMPHHNGSQTSGNMHQTPSSLHQASSSMQSSSQHQSKPVFTQANDSIKPPTAYHPAPAYSKAMSSGLPGLSSSSSKPFPQQLSAALATASTGGINHHHLMHPAHPTPPPYQPPPPTPSILEPPTQPPTTVAVQTTTSSTQSAPVVREPIRYEGEDLSMVAHPDLCRRLITAKTELKKLSSDNNNYMTELNKKIQDLLSESQNQKDLNHRLTEDNQELRDLCCFLDDDRQKGRKLAREWQRFGRYTASVMRQEVSNYQTKLRDLDGKQQALVKDNLELKELCLYLDEERGGGGAIPPPSSSGEPGEELAVGVGTNLCCECGGPALASPPAHPALLTATRDEGDGSSSSTNNDESEISGSNLVEELNLLEARESLYSKETIQLKYSGLNDDVLNYIRRLEDRLGISDNSLDLQSPAKTTSMKAEDTDGLAEDWRRPEAVSNALKVLSIQECILDRSMDSLDTDTDTDLGEGERAIVREMCNVVWKKLEEE